MVIEFTQHLTGIIERGNLNLGVMQLKIPQIMKNEASTLGLTHQAMGHYAWPSQMNPPQLQAKSIGASVCLS